MLCSNDEINEEAKSLMKNNYHGKFIKKCEKEHLEHDEERTVYTNICQYLNE